MSGEYSSLDNDREKWRKRTNDAFASDYWAVRFNQRQTTENYIAGIQRVTQLPRNAVTQSPGLQKYRLVQDYAAAIYPTTPNDPYTDKALASINDPKTGQKWQQNYLRAYTDPSTGPILPVQLYPDIPQHYPGKKRGRKESRTTRVERQRRDVYGRFTE